MTAERASPPRLIALATAVPRHRISQAEAADFGRAVFAARGAEFERLLPVYANAGIASRYAAMPADWLARPKRWPETMAAYKEGALALLESAASRCLAKVGFSPADVDGIVVVSTTGIVTPSLDALLMERLPFRRDVMRLPVFGLGCAGGVLGLARAAAMARAQPGETWLLLVVELCCLTFRPGDLSKSNVIATALFGDGAAAALVGAGGGGAPVLRHWGEYTWPGSLDVMGWHVEDDGLGVLFSRDIPTLVRNEFRPRIDAFLGKHDLSAREIAGWLMHPGGMKVLDALEDGLDLERGALTDARAVLHQYGNMSAATVFFVMERALAGCGAGRYLAGALGPGFTAGFLLLERDG